MCGIIGYAGRNQGLPIIVEGLRRLEYRGYDSAGVALITTEGISTVKRAGKLAALEGALDKIDLPPSMTGIGHTRWATHGAPNDRNAHPHLNPAQELAIIHNGIIENYVSLRRELESEGNDFLSETDSEVVAHLLGNAYEKCGGDLAEAMRQTCLRLEGAFSLVAIHAKSPDQVVGARRNSPLVVGVGKNERFLASDVAAFIEHTSDAIELSQDQVVLITPNDVSITDFSGNKVNGKEFKVTWDAAAAQKDGHPHFMAKEIMEQPKAVADTLLGRLDEKGKLILNEIRIAEEDLRDVEKIIIVGCGSAFHAGMIAKYAIEHWTRIPVEVELASEFRYRDPIIDRGTLVIAISQSGETMDTLMALRHAKDQRAKVLSICNTNGSTIPRESDGVLYTHAGPEVAVASTKAFLTQIVAAYLIGLYISQVRGLKFSDEIRKILEELQEMPGKIERFLETRESISKLAIELKDAGSVLFLGRHVGYPVALEGALKLKELAYLHAEGFAAGELKHGPIALIEEGTPVVVVLPSPSSPIYQKMLSNAQEVQARGAMTIVIADENDLDVKAAHIIRIPSCSVLLQPILSILPLQVFAYEMAVVRGLDVDQPRNLAKSVTVE